MLIMKKYKFLQTEKNKKLYEKIQAVRMLSYDAGLNADRKPKYSFEIDAIVDDLLEGIKKDLELNDDDNLFKKEPIFEWMEK